MSSSSYNEQMQGTRPAGCLTSYYTVRTLYTVHELCSIDEKLYKYAFVSVVYKYVFVSVDDCKYAENL